MDDDCEECVTIGRQCTFCLHDARRNKPDNLVERLLDTMDSEVDRFNEMEVYS